MANLISSSSDLVSSLQPQPPDGDGLTREDLAKRFYEFQAQIDRLKEENRRIAARNLVLEELCRGQLRSLEDRDEAIIRLKEDALSMSGAEGRLKEKYERLSEKFRKVREEFELGERKWRMKVEKAEEKGWQMEVEKTKLEIDLEAARKALADGGGEAGERVKAAEAEVERLKSVLEDKEGMIVEMVRRIEGLEREKRKVEGKLRDRVVKLEEAVSKWVGMSPGMDDFGADVRLKGNADSKDTGPKSAGKSLIQPKHEILEEEIQVEHDEKTLDSNDLGVGKELSFAQKSIDPPVVEISDDEEEEKRSSWNDSNPVVAPCVASPSTAKFHENLTVPRKRKAEAVTQSAERQSEPKRTKFDDPEDEKSWETADKMFNAFTTNKELCMKSVCALYRKHKSLGVWKNHSNRIPVYKACIKTSAVELGEFLTGGDPEGRMTKSLADFERERPRGTDHCRIISRNHFKELFEIYSSNLDPLFRP